MKNGKWLLASEDMYVKGFSSDQISPGGHVTYTFDKRLALKFDSQTEATKFRDSHRGVKAFAPRPEKLA